MFTADREFNPTPQTVVKFIQEHKKKHREYTKKEEYYKGHHDILHRKKDKGLSNHRLVVNHAKTITDTAVGYMVGNPITYSSQVNLDVFQEMVDSADISTHDMDIAKDCSIYGVGYELVYLSSGDVSIPKVTTIHPNQALVVYSNDVERIPLFGIYYFEVEKGLQVHLYTKDETICYTTTLDGNLKDLVSRTDHYFGEVPLVEFYNNEEQQGDFQQVVTLIDAYNVLQSDRINDKEQFVDAILVMSGANLADREETLEALQILQQTKLLELPMDGTAHYLTRQMVESDVEILSKAIERKIFTIAGIPNMSDDNFAGNTSGVAMKYKLLGFEQVIKIKERYFRQGIKRRIGLLCHVIHMMKAVKIRPSDIEITFNRNLPANEVELSQVVTALQGIVPTEILLSLLPFVNDTALAIKQLREEKEEKEHINQMETYEVSPLKDYDGGNPS